MRLHTIISGGQTGADLAGLRAAKSVGLQTGGWCPQMYMTETGPFPQLGTVYGLEEMHGVFDYLPRTRKNVFMSDATVIFGKRSIGSNKTEGFCQELGKPFVWLPLPLDHKSRLLFRMFLVKHDPEILNVAGNRESKNPGIGEAVYDFLTKTLKDRE